jgi:hypothetical protein
MSKIYVGLDTWDLIRLITDIDIVDRDGSYTDKGEIHEN